MIPAQARKPKPQGRDEGHTETPRHTTQTVGTLGRDGGHTETPRHTTKTLGTLAGLHLDHRVTVTISTGTFGVNLGGRGTHRPGGSSGPPRGHIHPGPKKLPHTLRALWILGRGHRSQRSSLAEDGSSGQERQSKRPLEPAPSRPRPNLRGRCHTHGGPLATKSPKGPVCPGCTLRATPSLEPWPG